MKTLFGWFIFLGVVVPIIFFICYAIVFLYIYVLGLNNAMNVAISAFTIAALVFLGDIILSALSRPARALNEKRQAFARERADMRTRKQIESSSAREKLYMHIADMRRTALMTAPDKDNSKIVDYLHEIIDRLVADTEIKEIDLKIEKSIIGDIELIKEKLIDSGLSQDMVMKRLEREFS